MNPVMGYPSNFLQCCHANLLMNWYMRLIRNPFIWLCSFEVTIYKFFSLDKSFSKCFISESYFFFETNKKGIIIRKWEEGWHINCLIVYHNYGLILYLFWNLLFFCCCQKPQLLTLDLRMYMPLTYTDSFVFFPFVINCTKNFLLSRNFSDRVIFSHPLNADHTVTIQVPREGDL